MQLLNVGTTDAAMKQKIDEALARIKEPESDHSIAQPGLVERLRYSAGEKSFTVFTTFIMPDHHYCCTILQGMLISGALKSHRTELQK